VATANPRRAARAAASPLVPLQRSIGNRAVGRLVQAKLKVGRPGDRVEQEADRVADRVMRTPAPNVSAAAVRHQSSRKCDTRDEGERLSNKPAASEAAAIVPDVLHSLGQPLDVATRAFFEPRFGHDFSRVRVHTGSSAGQSARDLNAQAYTVGHNMVFAAGRFAPGTREGQRLIAHELAHVVQQSDSNRMSASQSRVALGLSTLPTPLIQRKLLVKDKPSPKHIRALFDLLEWPSGLTLKYDPKSEEVSISAARAEPPSLALRLRLEEIIDDPHQHSELRLGGPRQGVSFGKFPDPGSLIQEIDIENLTRLEAGASGNGVAILFHEIIENYHAHAGRDYEESHEPALEAERQAAGELVRPGGRVARALVDKGKGVIRWVHDYEQYFLVYDRALKTDVVINSRRSSRVNVGTFAIDGFARGSDAVPPAAQPVIAAVANAMRTSPAATVRIAAGGQDRHLALRRAGRVQNAILDNGKGRQLPGFDLRSGFNFNLVTTGQSKEGLVIVVDQPDTEVEGYRGRLVEAWLTGKSRRPAPTKAGAAGLRPRR
jgi:hypothetical protein